MLKEKLISKHIKSIHSSINGPINKKLGKLNQHMRNIRINDVVDKEISENEKLMFNNYEDYLHNPLLIDNLFGFRNEKAIESDQEIKSDETIIELCNKREIKSIDKQVSIRIL